MKRLCLALVSLLVPTLPLVAHAQADAGSLDASARAAPVDRAAEVLRRGPLHVPPIRVARGYGHSAGRVLVLGSPQHARAAWWVPDELREPVTRLQSWPTAVRVVAQPDRREDQELLLVESIASFGRAGGSRFVVPLLVERPISSTYLPLFQTALVGRTDLVDGRESSVRQGLWETFGTMVGTSHTCRNIARHRTRVPVTVEALRTSEPLARVPLTFEPAEYNALLRQAYCESRASMVPDGLRNEANVVQVDHPTIAAVVLSGEGPFTVSAERSTIVGWIAKGPALVQSSPSAPRIVAPLRAPSARTQLWMRESTLGAARTLGEAPLLATASPMTISVVVADDAVHVLLSDGVAVRDNVLYERGAASTATHARFADVDGDGLTDVLVHGRSLIGGRPTPTGSILYFVREPGVRMYGDLERDYATQSLLVTDDPDDAVRRAMAYSPTTIDPSEALRFVDSRPIRAFAAAVDRASMRYSPNPPNARAALAAIRARMSPTAQLFYSCASPTYWTAPQRVDEPDADEYDTLARTLSNARSRDFLCQPRRAACVLPAGDRPSVVLTFVPSPRGPLIDRIVLTDTAD
ncbi:MAG: hypothetical protein JNK05_23650 [Myxococcales bacterium]|nr:hypothetical protein [Myxococcales bacterium]